MATDMDPARRAPTDKELADWAHNLLRDIGHRMSSEDCTAIAAIYDQIDARRARQAATAKEAA